MSAGHILALDQGTTSSRALVIDPDGQIVAVAQEEFRQRFPAPGHVEHDPEDIWTSQLSAARAALTHSGVSAQEIAGIGITNQRETTLLWRRDTGAPVHNALVWQDRRTAPRCEELRAAGLEEDLRRRTGLVVDPYFSATKLQWLLDRVEGVRAAAERGELVFGTVDTFILWRLTGGRVHATEPSNASRTLLWNIHTVEWDKTLLAEFHIPPEILPEVKPSSGVFGETDPEIFGRPIPITGIAGDQQAALFGQGCHSPGMAKNTYGTGCFLLVHTGADAAESASGLLTTVAWNLGDRLEYALEGSVFVAGAAVQWLRDGLQIIESASETEALARSVEDTGGVVIVPAFTGLGAPHWDPTARGTILGLTRGTGRAHLVRATLESIAHQVADVVEAMATDTQRPLSTLRVDGGAAQNDFLMQFQADLLGIPVERSAVQEATALGAGWLAGLGAGVWPSAEALRENWRCERVFEPQMSQDRRGRLRNQWARAVERARDWAN